MVVCLAIAGDVLMDARTFTQRILAPGLGVLHLNGGPEPSFEAERFLLAIALQESGQSLQHRYQVLIHGDPSVAGPARGWWQFERAGGVAGVLRHPATKRVAADLCRDLWVEPNSYAVWRALEGHDMLAVGFARLLVYTDPARLPRDENEAGAYYLRVWRPGKPRMDDWPDNWRLAATAT